MTAGNSLVMENMVTMVTDGVTDLQTPSLPMTFLFLAKDKPAIDQGRVLTTDGQMVLLLTMDGQRPLHILLGGMEEVDTTLRHGLDMGDILTGLAIHIPQHGLMIAPGAIKARVTAS
jgi:hypothetical protein